jgi:anaphase-promoting complex subunit 1
MLQPRLAGKGQQEQKDNHVLRCITLQPLGVSVGWKWQVSNYFDITCISALPIKSIPIAPSPIGLNADFSRVSDPKISRKQRNHIDEPYFAIDILLCKHGEKEEIGMPTELNIFRESNHIVLCSVPKSSSTLTSSYNSLNQFYLNNTLSAIGLRYSVNDRIDVLCRDLTNSQNVHTINVRVKVSLSFKKCPVAEDALLAVSSACLSHRDEIDLAFQLRSDCCRLSQALSILGEQNLDDDVEWSAFSSVLTQFMKVSTKKMLSRNNDVQISSAEIAGENSDDDSAWECLLKSDFNRNYVGENENHMFLISANDTEMKSASLKHESSSIHPVSALISSFTKNKLVEGGDLLEVATKIFDAMHLAYEEGKIKKSSVDMSSLRKLGQLLYEISVRGGDLMMDYSAHYTRDLYDLLPNEDDCTSNNTSHRLSKYRNPPCFFSWLESLTKAEFLTDNLPSTLNGMCATMSRSFHFLSILYFPKSSQQQKERDRLLVSSMVKEGFIDADRLLEKLPTGVALPIMDALLRCRSDPPPPFSSGFTSDAYELIGRPDLAQMQLSAETNIIKKSKPREDSAQTELPHANYLYAEDSPEVTNSLPSDDVEKDGLVSIERFSAMLFPDDNRVREAARLLRSSRRTFLRVHRPVEMSDHDYERLKQEKLGHLCRRVVALPLGRGMMTIGTFEPLPAEPLPMPTLCLSGRVPPLNATLLLDTTNWDEDSKMWPEFHNGVAAGLRLPQMGTNKMNELARTWIVYNKPVSRQSEQTDNASNANNNQNNESPHTTSHEHGGFLMALGLRGHLSALSMTDICDYLTQGSVTTAVGILLGVAANRRGTCDLSISKTLCLHVPSLLPPSFATIDVAAPIQAAAVAGIGLLYQGSSHRLMTEFLINEMGKRPTNDQNNSSRESYNLCCGLALGMVNLHCGADDAEMNRSGLSDLRIDERLHRYIVGGTDDRYQNERHDSFERQNNNNAPGSEQEKCSTIYEGDMINTGITAPGAMLALGMIHMKSG